MKTKLFLKIFRQCKFTVAYIVNLHSHFGCSARLGLLLAASIYPHIHDLNLQLLQAEAWFSGSQRIIVNMSSNVSDHLANKAVEKAITDKALGKKCGQYFIFIVT